MSALSVHYLLMDYKAESGRRIRLARKSAGYKSAEDLAREVGTSGSAMFMYERGERYISPEIAVKIAQKTGRTAGWIMAVEDDPELSPDEKALLHKYRLTDDRGRYQIQSIARAQPDDQPVKKAG